MTGERRLPVQRWHWVYISHRNNAGSWLLLDLVSVTNKTSLSHFSKFLHADFWSNLQSYFIFPEEWASLTSDHSLRTRWEQLLGKDVFIVSFFFFFFCLFLSLSFQPISWEMTPWGPKRVWHQCLPLKRIPNTKIFCPRLSCQGVEIRRGQAGLWSKI